MDSKEALRIIIRHQRRVEEEARKRVAETVVPAAASDGASAGEAVIGAVVEPAKGATLPLARRASPSSILDHESASPRALAPSLAPAQKTKQELSKSASVSVVLKALSAVQTERAETYRLWTAATETLLETGSRGMGTIPCLSLRLLDL